MPKFDGLKPNFRHRRVFGHILERFPNVGSLGAGIFRACEKNISRSMVGNWICDTGAFSFVFWGGSKMSTPREQGFFVRMRKKYFLALRWGMPQFDGRELNLRHRRVFGRVLGKFRNVGSPAVDFSLAWKIFLSIVVGNAPIRWSGTKFVTPTCFRSHYGAILKCQQPRSRDLSRACEKIFLGILVRNASIRWSETKFATSVRFRSHSLTVPKCMLPGARIFRAHAKKIFLVIVVGSAPIRWSGTEFETPARF